MSDNLDRLYNLLPAIYRLRDARANYPLRGLLRVINEQVNVVEDDIAQMYENWFIETCDDWVVPYIGDLIGYNSIFDVATANATGEQSQKLNSILVPRQAVANTINYERRKGTLAMLNDLARDIGGWRYSHAVEFYKLLGLTQSLLNPVARGHTLDVRQQETLERIDSAFDNVAHTVDVRFINSDFYDGWHNINNLGLFIWRLHPYAVSRTSARLIEEARNVWMFSVFGNEMQLYTKPMPDAAQEHLRYPNTIRRKDFERYPASYYGEDKSIYIWIQRDDDETATPQPISIDQIIVVDFDPQTSSYEPPDNYVAIDPERGLFVMSQETAEKIKDVWVTYHYVFSDDMGGGEYERSISQPSDAELYQVIQREPHTSYEYPSLELALQQWRKDKPCHAVIEFVESGVYTPNTRIEIRLQANQTLQIRAANGVRPVLRLLDYRVASSDALLIRGAPGSRVTFDGLIIMGRPLHISGDMDFINIRHCTLVPGWELEHNCEPLRPNEASLILTNSSAHTHIAQSILGSIIVRQNELLEPMLIHIHDSILDATNGQLNALSASDKDEIAHAVLKIERTTVIGNMLTHAIELGENSIFDGVIRVARRQIGCLRFCYVRPASRTPRRYNCQPDIVLQNAEKMYFSSPDEERIFMTSEELRVVPRFTSKRFTMPTYCQLAGDCAEEISKGADDAAEMGVWHDLFLPQRHANLLLRLETYLPIGFYADIIYTT